MPFCLYNPILNPYVPAEQAKDLTIDFSKFESEIITEVRAADKTIPLVSVLLAGRPVPIANLYEQSSAVIAAWLPGTSGGHGIVDLISGAYVARAGGSSNRKNSLSVDWPRSMVIALLFVESPRGIPDIRSGWRHPQNLRHSVPSRLRA